MSQENVELVQGLMLGPDVDIAPLFRDDDAWEAVLAGVADLIHPDFKCASTLLGIEREYVGVEGFRAFWLDWLAPWESYRTETEEITDLGDEGLQFAFTATRPAPKPSEPWGWRSRGCRRRTAAHPASLKRWPTWMPPGAQRGRSTRPECCQRPMGAAGFEPATSRV